MRAPPILLATVLAACGSAATPDAGGVEDAGIDAPASEDAGIDAPAPVDAPPANDGGPPDAPGTASLVGVVTRTADGSFLDPVPDGRGDLFVRLYDADPADTTTTANVVSEIRIDDVDLSTPEREVPYVLYGVPPRAGEYWIGAFLDDDEDASASDPRPDYGDSVASASGAAPRVMVPAAGEQAQDVVLNLALFFTP